MAADWQSYIYTSVEIMYEAILVQWMSETFGGYLNYVRNGHGYY